MLSDLCKRPILAFAVTIYLLVAYMGQLAAASAATDRPAAGR